LATLRYYLALVILSIGPGVIVSWFSIHPFVRLWRRVGARLTLAIHCILIAGTAGLVYFWREQLLAHDLGTQPVLVSFAVPLLAGSVMLSRGLRRQVRYTTLTGLPELDPERYESRLLTEGVYSRIRHPRYVQLILDLAACALFCNYLSVYVLLACTILSVPPLVRFEEKELHDRFGAEYDAYRDRVPAFLPRL
jgi:protein-S-isoprenylcysteine O-methyltransferase Ste14